MNMNTAQLFSEERHKYCETSLSVRLVSRDDEGREVSAVFLG